VNGANKAPERAAAGSAIGVNVEEKLTDVAEKSMPQSKKQKKGKKQVLLRFG